MEYSTLSINLIIILVSASLLALLGFIAMRHLIPAKNQLRHQPNLSDKLELRVYELMNALPSSIICIDQSYNITHWNKWISEETGLKHEDALNQSIFDVFPLFGISKNHIDEVFKHQKIQRIEGIPKAQFQKTLYYDATLCPINLKSSRQESIKGCLIRIDNVTDRVNLENLMIQNEKMLSIGELAAGMAHEINNPLSTVLQGVQNIFRRLSVDVERNYMIAESVGADLKTINGYLSKRDIIKILTSIQESGEQAVNIVKNLLEFSRKGPHVKKEIAINALIERCIELIRSNEELKSIIEYNQIKIMIEPEDTTFMVPCNKSEIQQVLLNILKNAIHAIADKNETQAQLLGNPEAGGVIIIKLSLETKIFCIEIKDNGSGMSATTLNRLFDPFYTTKPPGRGTGLGLAVSYFIITNHHGGSIDATSRENEGTNIKIKLPAQAQKIRQKLAEPNKAGLDYAPTNKTKASLRSTKVQIGIKSNSQENPQITH